MLLILRGTCPLHAATPNWSYIFFIKWLISTCVDVWGWQDDSENSHVLRCFHSLSCSDKCLASILRFDLTDDMVQWQLCNLWECFSCVCRCTLKSHPGLISNHYEDVSAFFFHKSNWYQTWFCTEHETALNLLSCCCRLLFHVLKSNVAQTLEQTLSLGINVWVGRAWSSFITYSVCHQSKHPPVIILLNVSDWWVMEGNTINSCFFGGRTLRLLQNFKFSLIIRRCANSELLRKSFWSFFLSVFTCPPICVCICSRVGVHNVVLLIWVCVDVCVSMCPFFASKIDP